MKERLFMKKDLSAVLRESGAGSNGGLKRNLSVYNLVTLGIGAIVGTGIFVLTGQAAAMYAGPALTISFLISALGCVMAGLCYAEFSSMVPVAGSVYSYSYSTLGEFMAWLIGWILVLEYLFACSSVAVGWSGYMMSILNEWGVTIPQYFSYATFDYVDGKWIWTGNFFNLPAVFIVVVVSSFLLGGIKQSALINNIIVVIKISVILLFIVFGASYVDFGNWEPYIPENTGTFGEFGWSGIFRGAGVVFFAYLGFDALSTAAQEARNPQRDMPRGILISLLICAVLYVAVTAVLTGIVYYEDLNSPAPMAVAIDKVGEALSWLSPLIKLGAIAGLSSVILVMMLGQSRIYYAISKDGLIPKIFSKVSKQGSPQNATIFAAIATSVFAALFPLHVLGELVSIGTLLAFAIVCICILILRKKEPNLNRPFKTPWVPFVPLLGAGICILQMVFLPWATWLRLVLWMVIGLIIYFTYGIRNSALGKEKNK